MLTQNMQKRTDNPCWTSQEFLSPCQHWPSSSTHCCLFESEANPSLPSNLSLSETLCSLKQGELRISTQIANNSSHDVTLQGHALLGRVNLVRSITPLQIGETPQSNEACSNRQKDRTNLEKRK